MTEFLGALDDPGLDGGTPLLELQPKKDSENEYFHFSGSGIYTFKTEEEIKYYLSNMVNNLI